MINRLPTRIELKLEDDLVEYEEICSIKKKNSEKNKTIINNIHNNNFNLISPVINLNKKNFELLTTNHNIRLQFTQQNTFDYNSNNNISKLIPEFDEFEKLEKNELNMAEIIKYKTDHIINDITMK